MNLIYNNVYAYWKTPKIDEADNLVHTTEIYLSFLNGSYLYVKYETFKMLTKTNKTLHLKHLNVIISYIYRSFYKVFKTENCVILLYDMYIFLLRTALLYRIKGFLVDFDRWFSFKEVTETYIELKKIIINPFLGRKLVKLKTNKYNIEWLLK